MGEYDIPAEAGYRTKPPAPDRETITERIQRLNGKALDILAHATIASQRAFSEMPMPEGAEAEPKVFGVTEELDLLHKRMCMIEQLTIRLSREI